VATPLTDDTTLRTARTVGNLPFTGLSLLVAVLLSLTFVVSGLGVRRAARVT
jgi:hypothetical protein